MTIDTKLLLSDPDLIRKSQLKRYKSVDIVDLCILINTELRTVKKNLDQLRSEVNNLNKQKIHNSDKKDQIKVLEQQYTHLEKQLSDVLNEIGNLIHDSVPINDNEDYNEVIRSWGSIPSKETFEPHDKLLLKIGAYDPERGVKVAGHRAYFLKDMGVKLNLALIQYSLDFLSEQGYTILEPPYFMNAEVMSQTAQLEDFDQTLYKISDSKYLIATSEQPISAFHMNEKLDPKKLPLKYCGVSKCFRKEAGAHGRDVAGLFRIHQFDKIEQFCITTPDQSWDMMEHMIGICEKFYQSLDLPYRIVNIVSGALNNAAAKKYDLEAWFYSYNTYRELVSCSNCTDYQSRNLNIKSGKQYVHMLNSTLCATSRTLCCILENYQTKEGIIVPEVLRPYMKGLESIPFLN